MRIILITLAWVFATLALAQSLPMFDVARFDQVTFGSSVPIDPTAPAIPVSTLPTWALLLLASILWIAAIAVKRRSSKELTS